MFRRILLFVAVVVVVGTIVTTIRYRHGYATTSERLEAGARVIETARGRIELARVGTRGPAVLVLHGTPGGYDQAVGLGEAAQQAGFQFLAVSRPGYLRTPIEMGRTPAEQADAYAALLDALDIERVAVVGISGGGPSALEFAVRHPDRCWALVDLMGVSRSRLPDETGPADDLDSPIFQMLLGTDFGGWLVGSMLRRDPATMLEALIPDPEIRARILDDPGKLERFVALAESSLALASRRSVGTANDIEQFAALDIELERIRAPTLILHGTADVNVPLAMAELVAEKVDGAELKTFPGADHFMVLSHDQEVFGALFDFLRTHSDGA